MGTTKQHAQSPSATSVQKHTQPSPALPLIAAAPTIITGFPSATQTMDGHALPKSAT